MKAWLDPIKELGACQEALDWADKYDSLEEAWAACECYDWMRWLFHRLLRLNEWWDVYNTISEGAWLSASSKKRADIIRKHYPKPPVKEE